MKLQTMADIRADLTKQGFDDEFIKLTITARINKERAIADRKAKRAKDAIAVKRVIAALAKHELTKTQCPQQRADATAIEPLSPKSPRGLIMVGEW